MMCNYSTEILNMDIPMTTKEELVRMIKSDVLPLFTGKNKNGCRLVLEELLVNILSYGNAKRVNLKVVRYDESAVFFITDNGEEFSPVLYKPRECRGDSVGGHGLRIVKDLARVFLYERKEDKNVLAIEVGEAF